MFNESEHMSQYVPVLRAISNQTGQYTLSGWGETMPPEVVRHGVKAPRPQAKNKLLVSFDR
jgi:hypothetical protein